MIGLTKCEPREFEVMAPSSKPGSTVWVTMHSDWSDEAVPGDWVRRSGSRPLRSRPKPEGILVAAVHPHQVDNDPRRFLVLWFK